MRWLIRSTLTILVSIPFFLYIFNPDAYENGFIANMEYLAYDARTNLNLSNESDPNVFILDVDEKSIAEIGQWPWPRDVLAELNDILFEYYEIKVLGYDIAFPEPDRALDVELLDELELALQEQELPVDLKEMRKMRERDRLFAESIAGRKVVLGFVFDQNEGSEPVGLLPEAIMPSSFLPEGTGIYEAQSYIGNLPILQKVAASAGNFNPFTIDPDGKIRSIPMLVDYANYLYESLPLAIARQALDVEEIQFKYLDEISQDEVSNIRLGTSEFPIGDGFEMLIPYRGDVGTFRYVSVADIMRKALPKNEFVSGIMIMGTSAAGLKDIRVTPVSENYPGVEINASMISGIMSGSMLRPPVEYESFMIQLIIFLLAGLVLTLVMPTMPVLLSTLSALSLSVIAIFINQYAWIKGLAFPIAPTLLFITSAYITHLIYGAFIESRRKKQLTRLFGQYVPPELVEEMEEDLASYSMEPRDQELTVMFADIEGFTKMSEDLEVEQVTGILNEFLTLMTQVIQDKRGTIDKYMGDAIMAFWGAPVPDENHARRALDAAMGMLSEMEAFNQRLSSQGLPEFNVRIGLNTGVMSVGDMGSEFRRAYTVIGDEVNLASRIEGLTRHYGVSILIGENTRKSLNDEFCMELDKVIVKGKDNSVILYQPLGLISEMTDAQGSLLTKNKEAIDAYREQNWGQAEILFSDLSETYPEQKVFSVYLERINDFKLNPPAFDWDGSFRYLSK